MYYFSHFFHRIEKDLPFEKAYCLYRLNQADEALQVLNDIPEQGQKEKELMAQVVRYNFSWYTKQGRGSRGRVCVSTNMILEDI